MFTKKLLSTLVCAVSMAPLTGLSLMISSLSAQAQVACPNDSVQTNQVGNYAYSFAERNLSGGSATCTSSVAIPTDGIRVFSSWNDCKTGKFNFVRESGGGAVPTSLDCPNCNNTTSREAVLAPGTSSSVTAFFNFPDSEVARYTATISRSTADANGRYICSIANAQIAGGAFGGDIVAPTVSILNAPSSHDGVSAFNINFEFSEDVTGFEIGDATVDNGSISDFVTIDGNSYQATITPTGAQDITIDIAADVAQDNGLNGNIAAPRVTVTYIANAKPVELIGSFIQARGNLITQNRPNQSRRIDRLNGNDTNNGGVSGFGIGVVSGYLPFSANLSENQSHFAYSMRKSEAEKPDTRFAADPFAMLSHAGIKSNEPYFPNPITEQSETQVDALAYAATANKKSAYDAFDALALAQDLDDQQIEDIKRFDFWVEGQRTQFSEKNGDGNFTILHSGADYLITKNILIGVGAQLDWTNYDQTIDSGHADGFGYMIGPYITTKLSDRFYFDANASWGKADNTASPFGTFSDDFSSERWLVNAAITGDFDHDNFNIRPEMRLSYYREDTKAFTNSLSMNIPSLSYEAGTLDFGPTISTKLNLGDDFILSPQVGLKGIWTFASRNTANQYLSNSQNLVNEGIRASGKAGFSLIHSNGTSLDINASYDGIGEDDYQAWSIKGGVSVKW